MKKLKILIIIISVILIIGIALFLFKDKNKIANNENKIEPKIETTSTENLKSNDFSTLFENGYKGSSELSIKSVNNEDIFTTNTNFNGNSDLIHQTFTSNKSNQPSEIIYSFKDGCVYLKNGEKYSKYSKQILGSISVLNLNDINNSLSTLKNDLKIDYINEKYEATLKDNSSNNNLFKTFLPYNNIDDLKIIKDLSFKLTFNKEKLLESENLFFSFMLDNEEYKLTYTMAVEPSNEKITLPTE